MELTAELKASCEAYLRTCADVNEAAGMTDACGIAFNTWRRQMVEAGESGAYAHLIGKTRTEVLDILFIIADEGVQPRAQLDMNAVEQYAIDMRLGATFPAGRVFHDCGRFYLSRGFHRLEAIKMVPATEMLVEVFEGTKRDAILDAMEDNRIHGVRYTNADRRKSVTMLLHDEEWREWSDREIGRRVAWCTGQGLKVIAETRAFIYPDRIDNPRKVQRGETVYTQNTANIGSNPKPQEEHNEEHTESTPEPATPAEQPAQSAGHHQGTPTCDEPQDGGGVCDTSNSSDTAASGTPEPQTNLLKTDSRSDAEECGEEQLEGQGAFQTLPGVIATAPNIMQDHQLLNQSGSVEWYTPAPYVEAARDVMGSIDLDPASCESANAVVRAKQFFTAEDDGYLRVWRGNVWLNPPYGYRDNVSNQALWSAKLLFEYSEGHVSQAVLLVNAVPGNKWFAPLWDYLICFPDHRIRFYNDDTEAGHPTHSNALVYLGPNTDKFAQVFSEFGTVVSRYELRTNA